MLSFTPRWSIKPILTDFQVRTGKYKALVFYPQPSSSRWAVLENAGFVFPRTDLKISQYWDNIKSDVEEKTKKLHGEGGISDKLLLHTIGFYQTENGDYSRVKKNAKYFTVDNPGYNYPLFKTHKLNPDEIEDKPATSIPVQIVCTSRCTFMLESLLKSITVQYCGSEYTHDISHYLEALIEWKQQAIANGINREDLHLIVIDIEALYPSCSRDLVTRALRHAMSKSR